MSAFDALAEEIRRAMREIVPSWEVGTVKAVEPSSSGAPIVTVTWNGADVVVGYGSTYTPAPGDVVWMARKGQQLMVVDRYVGLPPEHAPVVEGDLT